jgi:hypothetical protein
MNLFLGAAVLLAGLAPGAASAQSGHIDLSYTDSDSDLGNGVESTSIGGSIAFADHVQLDARYMDVQQDPSPEAAAWDVGGHVHMRNSSWLIGGYVGYQTIDGASTAHEYTYAVESQFYIDRSTISATFSYSDDDSPAGAELTVLDGQYKFFATDNLSLTGGLGWGQGELNSFAVDYWDANLGVEYQFNGTPISLFAGYRHGDFGSDVGEIETDAFGAGVRWNFGGGTLLERNRSGASLARPLNALERVFGSLTP